MNRFAKFTYYALRVLLWIVAIYIFIAEPIATYFAKGWEAVLAYYFAIAVVIGLFKLYRWANNKMDEMEDNDGSTT